MNESASNDIPSLRETDHGAVPTCRAGRAPQFQRIFVSLPQLAPPPRHPSPSRVILLVIARHEPFLEIRRRRELPHPPPASASVVSEHIFNEASVESRTFKKVKESNRERPFPANLRKDSALD